MIQDDLVTQNPATEIRILGVNAEFHEGGNPTITAAPRDLPWLQDTLPPGAWALFGAKKDVVIILDRQNVPVQVYDLGVNPLPANSNALKALLKSVAGEP